LDRSRVLHLDTLPIGVLSNLGLKSQIFFFFFKNPFDHCVVVLALFEHFARDGLEDFENIPVLTYRRFYMLNLEEICNLFSELDVLEKLFLFFDFALTFVRHDDDRI